MSFSIKPLPIHAIIISTPHRDFDAGREMASFIRDLLGELDRAARPATFITVIDELDSGSGNLCGYLAGLTRGERAVASHPNVKSMIVVTTNEQIVQQAEEIVQLPLMVTRTLADAVAQAG